MCYTCCMNKQCAKCKQMLPVSNFYANCKAPDKLAYSCKSCANSYVRKWARDNREKAYSYQKRSRSKKPEHYKAKDDTWRKANPRAAVEKTMKWAANNPGTKLAANARRRAGKVKATPLWADLDKIKQLYKLAALWNKIWPEDPVHVDHIIPLKGKYVTGLHVETNLQIIRAADNIQKSNKLLDISST